MRLGKTLLLAAMILSIGVSPASSQIVKKGQVGFRFLENPVSAEAIGRGGVGVAMFRNSNAVFWNPGALGWITGKFDFNVNHTQGIAEINQTSAVGAAKIGNLGVVAFDIIAMDYGDFYGTRRADNDQGFEDTGVFSPSAFALGLTFSQKVSDRFSYGLPPWLPRKDLTRKANRPWILARFTIFFITAFALAPSFKTSRAKCVMKKKSFHCPSL